MSLPSLARVSSAPAATLRAFGRKLVALGVTREAAAPIVEAANAVAPGLRQPIRAFHLRRLDTPVGYAMRMFLFSDPVTFVEARAALGELTDTLVDLGLLERCAGGGFASPFVLSLIDDLLIFSDDLSHGRDAVMGFGETTVELCGAAFPKQNVQRVLDLGCGSGTAALLLAKRARASVGVDINPRAIALSKINAAINGITNIEFRLGDLFAPVEGETFDLIVSQPPFVPRPAGLGASDFLYGGPRGDELALTLLSKLTPHLAPGGRALVVVEWPDHGTEALDVRLRKAINTGDVNLLLLRMPHTELDGHAVSYAAGLHPTLGRPFEQEARVRREHLEQMGIRALLPTLAVIERADPTPGWTMTVAIESLTRVSFTSERIDRLLAAQAVAASPDRLLATKVRMPAGSVLSQEQVGPGADAPSTLHARFAPAALIPPLQLTIELLGLLTFLHEAPNVRVAIERFANELEIPLDEAMPRSLEAAARALREGILEIASPL
jgi:methylase of polypeptide subunit release factors